MHKWLILFFSLVCGCSTMNVTVSGNNNTVLVEQPKTVTTTPTASVTTGDNTLPLKFP